MAMPVSICLEIRTRKREGSPWVRDIEMTYAEIGWIAMTGWVHVMERQRSIMALRGGFSDPFPCVQGGHQGVRVDCA